MKDTINSWQSLSTKAKNLKKKSIAYNKRFKIRLRLSLIRIDRSRRMMIGFRS